MIFGINRLIGQSDGIATFIETNVDGYNNGSPDRDFDTDTYSRNVHFTESGLDRLEAELQARTITEVRRSMRNRTIPADSALIRAISRVP